MRGYLLMSLLALAGCATPYVPPEKGGTSLDYIQQDDDRLGWSGIYPGDTLEAVEKKLGRNLSPYPDEYPACGGLSADFTLRDRKVVLQLEERRGVTIVESITVDLPDSEWDLGMARMADTLKRRFSGLDVVSSDADSVELVTSDHQAVLIKNHKEHFLDVTRAGCID